MQKQRFIIGLFLFLGLVASICSGTFLRLSSAASSIPLFVYTRYLLLRYASELWPLWLAIAITIYSRFKLGIFRFATIKPHAYLNFIASLIGLIISASVYSLERGLWPVYLFCTIQILFCANAIFPRHIKPYSKEKIALLSAISFSYIAWFASLATWQYKFTAENKKLFSLVEKAEQPLVYCDLTDNSQVPFFLLGMVKHYWTYDPYGNYYLSIHFGRYYQTIILPTKYKGIPIDSLSVPGSKNIKGVYPTMYSKESHNFYAKLFLSGTTPAMSPIERVIAKIMSDPVEVWITYPEYSFFNGKTTINGETIINGETYYLYYPDLPKRSSVNRIFLRLEDTDKPIH